MHELSPGDKQNIVQSLWFTWSSGGNALSELPKAVKRVIDTGAWKDREVDGRPFTNASFREFIVSRPLQGCGWGEEIDAIERVLGLKAPEVLVMWREAMTGGQGTRNDLTEHRSIPTKSDRGLAYTLSRLARTAPELYQRVLNGELSANAAAIAAGFRRKPTAYERVVRLIAQLTKDELDQLAEEIRALTE